MADYAGAAAAIRAHFVANWTLTPIALPNTPPPSTPWPPETPWVYLEVSATSSDRRGAGKPGDQTWLTIGLVHVQVFVPKDYGVTDIEQLATAAGEVFRGRTIYTDGAGSKVIFGAPLPTGDVFKARADGNQDGNQFGLTCSVPFEFFFRA